VAHEAIEPAFAEVVGLIRAARQRAAQVVNTEVIDLYWHIGQYLHHKIEADGWAKGTVVQLAAYIAQREPGKRGFSSQNLWRMRQFYQAYPAAEKLSTLLRVLPWSSHLHILSRTKRPEERTFYLRMAALQRWQVREVARQIDAGLFERAVLNPPKLSTADLKPCLPWLGQVPAHWQTVDNGGMFGQRSQIGYAELPILEVSLKTGVQVRSFRQARSEMRAGQWTPPSAPTFARRSSRSGARSPTRCSRHGSRW
jgi:predicted nuclease of restriction endonuclease-like (RecB) superfamily